MRGSELLLVVALLPICILMVGMMGVSAAIV